MALGAGLRLAVGTLTIVPVGEINPLPAGAGRVAMSLAPLAALPVAVVAGAVPWLTLLAGAPALVAAGLCLAAVAVMTRAMHLDGFADTVDGLGGGWSRERALEIMKRGDVGPMGAAGIALLLIVQCGALVAVAHLPWAALLAGTAICASRFAATLLCAAPVPSARESGLGSVVARSVPIPVVGAVALLCGAALCAAATISGLSWWWGAVALLAMLGALGMLLAMAMRKIGGVTGDVMGAGIELAFTAMLVVLSIGAAA